MQLVPQVEVRICCEKETLEKKEGRSREYFAAPQPDLRMCETFFNSYVKFKLCITSFNICPHDILMLFLLLLKCSLILERSARVGPLLTKAIGIFNLAALSTKRYAEYTSNEVPIISKPSAFSNSEYTVSTLFVGTLFPKKITCGIKTPEHFGQFGIQNLL